MSNVYAVTLSSTHGKFWQRAGSAMENDDLWLKQLVDCMTQMLDGDGSQDAHYTTMATACGFASAAIAHSAFNELMSCYSKTSGNGSVSDVRAARDQFCSRIRI